jgi:hypothetical protein
MQLGWSSPLPRDIDKVYLPPAEAKLLRQTNLLKTDTNGTKSPLARWPLGGGVP